MKNRTVQTEHEAAPDPRTDNSAHSLHNRGRERKGGRRRGPLVLILPLLALSALRCSGPQSAEPLPRGPEVPAADVAVLAISPSNVVVAQGTVQPFTTRGLLLDGQSKDLTAQTRFTIRDEAGHTLAAQAEGLLPFARPGRYTVTAEHAGRSISTPVTVTAATISSLSVSPSTPSVPVGLTKAFKATAKFSDGTSQDVTAMAAWSVKDTVGTGVALVESTGVATAKAVGKARVQARYLTKTSYTTMEVTPAVLSSLAISPSNPSIAKGTAQAFAAAGTYSDGSTVDVSALVTWSIADVDGSGVAAIDGSGTAFGRSVGKAKVSAELGTQLVETTLTVTAAAVTAIATSPASPVIAKGLTQQFSAMASMTDGSTQDVTKLAAWSAADQEGVAVASVDASGLARGNNVGKARIQASYGGKSTASTLQVTPALLISLALEPSTLSLPKGLSARLQALGTFTDGTQQDLSPVATWTTTDVMGIGIASVDGSGLVQAKAQGRARIDASYGTRTASATIEVTAATVRKLAVAPRSVQLGKGGKQAFTATATMSDGALVDVTAAAAWTTADVSGSGVASIDRTGLLTGNAAGRADVKATYVGFSDTAQVTVGAFGLVASGTTTGLRRIWGSADDNLWITGWDGALLHWNGTIFTRHVITTDMLYAVWGTGPNDIWTSGMGSKAWHWDGISWKSMPLGAAGTVVYEIWGSGPNDVWFAGQSGLTHWDGTGFTKTALPGIEAWSVWGVSATDIWAIGRGALIAHYNGTAWAQTALPVATSESFESIQGSGSRDIWTVGSMGSLLHYDGTSWQKAVHPAPAYTPGLAVVSATEAWAVSGYGDILRFDGTSWSKVLSPTTNMLFTMWASPTGRIWSSGGNGTVIRN